MSAGCKSSRRHTPPDPRGAAVLTTSRSCSRGVRIRSKKATSMVIGQITAADAAITLQMAVSGERDDTADMDYGGHVTSVDALMILRAAGAINMR